MPKQQQQKKINSTLASSYASEIEPQHTKKLKLYNYPTLRLRTQTLTSQPRSPTTNPPDLGQWKKHLRQPAAFSLTDVCELPGLAEQSWARHSALVWHLSHWVCWRKKRAKWKEEEKQQTFDESHTSYERRKQRWILRKTCARFFL